MSISKFSQFLNEGLTASMMTEPSSEAAKMAKTMSLTYVGFGRYADKTGAVKYIVKNDKLLPFKGQQEDSKTLQSIDDNIAKTTAKTNSFKHFDQEKKKTIQAIRTDDNIKNSYQKQNTKEVIALATQLSSFYQPTLFTPEEVDAIKAYTETDFTSINRYLYKGFDPETQPDQANVVAQKIQNIDAAFEETGAPFDYTTYTGLSARYDFRKIKPGKDYIFRGYISTSLDHDIAIDQFSDLNQEAGVVFEIDIEEGQKSIYVDNISDATGEMETILPRGTKLRVVSGPHMVDSTITQTSDGVSSQVALFKCSIIEE